MSPIDIGTLSVIAIIVMVYMGFWIPIALSVVSLVAIWMLQGNINVSINLLKIAISDSVMEYTFATIPLFTFMGLIVAKAGMGTDIYQVMNVIFRSVRGGIGMATVGANAVFAAVTGSSIASASVFTKVSVPQMTQYGYNKRLAVGIVAGSSVLGMIIPPSAMLIIYAFVAEQSVGDMFLAGIVPGILLAITYIVTIWILVRIWKNSITDGGNKNTYKPMSYGNLCKKTLPLVSIICIVLGGIYTGQMTPVEAGAVGATIGLGIAIIGGKITLKIFWESLIETGHISASILFLITSASIYSRMLGIAGLPNELAIILENAQLNLTLILLIYVILMLFLGTLLDTASIILIVVPLFLPLIEPLGLNLVWFGIITVIGAEIGLLTPPLGISCFVIKSTLNDDSIALKDIFIGAFPFSFAMLLVLIVLIKYPVLSIGILQ